MLGPESKAVICGLPPYVVVRLIAGEVSVERPGPAPAVGLAAESPGRTGRRVWSLTVDRPRRPRSPAVCRENGACGRCNGAPSGCGWSCPPEPGVPHDFTA